MDPRATSDVAATRLTFACLIPEHRGETDAIPVAPDVPRGDVDCEMYYEFDLGFDEVYES